MAKNPNPAKKCADCGAPFINYGSASCCVPHKGWCPECSVKEHINDMEHGLALAAKARFELPSVRIKVR